MVRPCVSMRIRLKTRGAFGIKRIPFDGRIEKVERGQDGGLDLYVRGLEGLGLISFSQKEIGMLGGKTERKKTDVVKKKAVRKRVSKRRKR